ncbi:MAG: NFACT RNA binding domain-containing protein, partial [Candidatus Micrarchaeia archaeon]
MEVKIDFTLSAQQNADLYYKKAKKLLIKKNGAKDAIEELNKRLNEIKKHSVEETHKVKVTTNKEWFEKFHWFFTSDGLLVISGSDAHQNELINSRYFEDQDLFFHADIFGASATLLKNGANATLSSKEEAAQFAGCFSSAWGRMLSTIDVYALRRDQVSKSTNKGSLGTGSFLLKGEREWFKGVSLELSMFLEKGKLIVMPQLAFSRIGYKGIFVNIKEGNMKKSDAAKTIAKILGYDDIDEIMRALPAGGFYVNV